MNVPFDSGNGMLVLRVGEGTIEIPVPELRVKETPVPVVLWANVVFETGKGGVLPVDV